jgi:hypothetical protein
MPVPLRGALGYLVETWNVEPLDDHRVAYAEPVEPTLRIGDT